MHIDEPRDFFRLLHPTGQTSGQILLERRFNRAQSKQSLIHPNELERIAKSAHRVPELYFSIASYTGDVLLLNFEKTTALHLQIPNRDYFTYLQASQLLVDQGIPLPSAVLSDDETHTLLWILDRPIPSWGFYRYFLLENALYKAALVKPSSTRWAASTPIEQSKDITFRTRLVGTLNSKTGNTVAISRFSNEKHNLSRLEESIPSNLSAAEYSRYQRQAGIILELRALMSDRWWTINYRPELYVDWILFFGASICHFCSEKPLLKNLKAISESLENKPWSAIRSKYQPVVKSICETAKNGYINIDGESIAISGSHWLGLIRKKLEITEREIGDLSLYIIGETDTTSPHIHRMNGSLQPVGVKTFEPYQKLLIHAAS